MPQPGDMQGEAQQPLAKRRKISEVPGLKKRPENGRSASAAAALERERAALPIWSARAKLVELVKAQGTTVVIGETGSGKTTQLPRFLWEGGLAAGKMVACTQPRRVAALTVARRVAQEMGVPLGQQVGYSIRFDDCTSAATRIKYMTDGMLLREALLDPTLSKYKVVILDEAHERTVHTDVLFGLLKGVQARRSDGFKLLVMSATLDAAKFVDYFNDAKAAYIQGRQFPVSVMYTAQPEASYIDAALTAALQVHCEEGPGDILVFLTGQDEIESAERLIRDRGAALPAGSAPYALKVVSIYAAMPPERQLAVFEPVPPDTRKVILATNIAETSITISGVRYVIDSGFMKARSYSPRLGADSLQVTPVSQAQARQRSGRAGREAPGKCYRLYTEEAFSSLSPVTPPEIQRMNLAGVVLQLLALGVEDVLGFDFMDPPPRAAVVRAMELLLALQAVGTDGRLTIPLGERMSRLPVEPMYAKVLLAAVGSGCAAEALSVTAMVSTDNIFHKPRNDAAGPPASRRRFTSSVGDHVALLALYREYTSLPQRDRQRWCKEQGVNSRSMTKAVDIHQQLARHLGSLGLPLDSCGDDTVPLRRALVSGLFMHAAKLQPDGTYKVLSTGQLVSIHPSSVLSGHKPGCIVFDELMRTTRYYARTVAAVEAAWLPELVPTYFASV